MLCLPIVLLPGWLFGITASRVRPDLHDKIVRYRRECFRVLWAAFKHEILPPAELALVAAQSAAALAYELATAVQNLAREQMEVEQDWTRPRTGRKPLTSG
jgi:antirepressor protein